MCIRDRPGVARDAARAGLDAGRPGALTGDRQRRAGEAAVARVVEREGGLRRDVDVEVVIVDDVRRVRLRDHGVVADGDGEIGGLDDESCRRCVREVMSLVIAVSYTHLTLPTS